MTLTYRKDKRKEVCIICFFLSFSSILEIICEQDSKKDYLNNIKIRKGRRSLLENVIFNSKF